MNTLVLTRSGFSTTPMINMGILFLTLFIDGAVSQVKEK
jgi:hypothetical protein